MVRWLIVVFFALVLINGLAPLLRKLGLGRIPGDFNFRFRGRAWSIPLGSTVLLTLIATAIARLL